MKNRRRKRKRITPQRRPVVSEAIDTVTPPFIHNLLCIMLPKGIFQSMEHYAAFVDKVIENEGLPIRYGVLHPCCGDPKCNRVVFHIKSDPHSHDKQFCYYSHTPSAIKSLANISRENALAEMIPETSTAFPKEHLNCPQVPRLDILTVDQLQHLWKKLVHSTAAIDDRASGEQICFEGDMAFSPFPPEHAHIIEELGAEGGIC